MYLELYETKNESIIVNDFDNLYHSYKLSFQSDATLILFKYPKSCLLNSTNTLDNTNIIMGQYTCISKVLSNIYFGIILQDNYITVTIERDDKTITSFNLNFVLKIGMNKSISINISVLLGLLIGTVLVASTVTTKSHSIIIKRKKKKKIEESNKVSFVNIKL